MDATVIIVFGCSDNFRLFYCVFAIKKTCIFVSDGAILCFYMIRIHWLSTSLCIQCDQFGYCALKIVLL